MGPDQLRPARCRGAPAGASVPTQVPLAPDDPWLQNAVGDIRARFYDGNGAPLAFPGSKRLLSSDLQTLRRSPTTIALATAPEKLGSSRAGARAGWINQLVTDTSTAQGLLGAGT